MLFMHPTGFTETSRMGPWHLGNLIGNPLESTVAVHHLIFGGVLDAYPGLKLVIAHGGGFLPSYSGRIDHGAAARPDTCEHIHHDPTHYLKRLYFDTMVFTHHQLEYLVEAMGRRSHPDGHRLSVRHGRGRSDRLCRGRQKLSDGDRKAILGGNAARLLNIPLEGAHMSLTLAQASTIVDTALAKGRELKLHPLTVVVLDAGGHMVAMKREDE